jgi:hypothetical protein
VVIQVFEDFLQRKLSENMTGRDWRVSGSDKNSRQLLRTTLIRRARRTKSTSCLGEMAVADETAAS